MVINKIIKDTIANEMMENSWLMIEGLKVFK